MTSNQSAKYLLPRGIFLNSVKANCSIYESGLMAYECLRLSHQYELDYKEIDADCHGVGDYDFYVFNYHHATMAWMNTKSVRALKGKTFTLVLETLPNNPFVLCPPNDFDAYLTLDPTMDIDDVRVYAFPRPLEVPESIPAYQDSGIPIIGSFGFATPGKGFDHVVTAVNQEFDRAVIR